MLLQPLSKASPDEEISKPEFDEVFKLVSDVGKLRVIAFEEITTPLPTEIVKVTVPEVPPPVNPLPAVTPDIPLLLPVSPLSPLSPLVPPLPEIPWSPLSPLKAAVPGVPCEP
ncbi:hypothetical protein COT75_00400 [Candidatus Beckwithbacteria bacterium CG10_big_fil_rev_8_21_14_0_10_34_10]|uniref:Uncharacterized protein n=1 Tax=Candidatus Beckwithbacteria bacterium CG10_big_fil_rev_8_21_14_0_10_34_10 TaxID=1974495 RepID=A0A2H0WAQ6_9BACT|nr:MAG: hypothetical protein COT75_00400 [Candidatus Beckwithbacteria bacterium CG10_big_fil_rev_8_21_14_0_10_34_10]